jgi:hypothetical protein
VFRWRAAAAVLLAGNAALMALALRPAGTGHAPMARAPVAAELREMTSVASGGAVQSADRADVTRATWSWFPAARPAAAPLKPSPDAGYLPLRDAVLRDGLSALPEPSARGAIGQRPLRLRQLLGT